MPGRLPWYAVLYRVFGAQGTFWLWIASVAALWWTTSPTIVRLANRAPHALDPAQVARCDDLTRWVDVGRGLVVRFDRRLLLHEEPPGLPPVPLLLDLADPAARWWSETWLLARLAAVDAAAPPALGGLAGALPSACRARLPQRMARLTGDPEAHLPAPERAVLVQDHAPPSLASAPHDAGRPLSVARFEERLDAWAALVRERVEAPRPVRGLLVGTPPAVARRIREDLKVEVGPWLVQEGREPRDTESWVFATAAITLLLLAGGLYGLLRA